jgi:Chalcone isomerase-like
MNSVLRTLLFACLLAAGPVVQAARIAGVEFDERVRVAGSELLLNGVGVRQVAWLQGYAAALYLGRKAGTASQAIATAGPKRIRLQLLVDVQAKEFAKAVDKGMRRNHSPAELQALKPRIAQFDALLLAFGPLRRNEVIDLDFVPGSGVVLLRNGNPQGAPLIGDDLYAGLMKIFIGDVPVDAALKAGLLGGS